MATTLTVLIGRQDGILSSVGLAFGRELQLLHGRLMWIGAAERRARIGELIALCEALQAAGVTVDGLERLRGLVTA